MVSDPALGPNIFFGYPYMEQFYFGASKYSDIMSI